MFGCFCVKINTKFGDIYVKIHTFRYFNACITKEKKCTKRLPCPYLGSQAKNKFHGHSTIDIADHSKAKNPFQRACRAERIKRFVNGDASRMAGEI